MNIQSIKQSPNALLPILQPQLPTDQSHHFCYFDIRNPQTLITQSILLFLSLIICLVAIKKYCDIWKMLSSGNKNANLVYFGILVWWISYIAKDMYGLAIYLIYNSKNDVASQLSWFSKLYFSLDWANAFVLQTLLIFVPYHWMRQISQALSVVSGLDSESGVEDDGNFIHYKGIEAKLFPLLKKYLFLRILCIVPIILFLVLTDFNTISLISKIMLLILLLDCIIIIVVLSLGIYSLKSSELLNMQLDRDESKRLFNQYLIIILSTGLRFANDLFIFIWGAAENLTQDDCSLPSQTSWSTLVLIVSITLLAHFLPILIILRIYTIQQKPQDITKSIIMD